MVSALRGFPCNMIKGVRMIKKATMHLRINIKKTQLTTINALARLARYSYDITSDL